jgi:isoamylase
MARLGEGDRPGQLYAYRVDGPYEPSEGHRSLRHGDFASAPVGFCIGTWLRPVGAGARLGFLEAGQFQLDAEMRICQRALRLAWRPAASASVVEDVIYETHVCGFTIHPKSGVEHPGTYRGLMEKLSYLKTLGVTAVELMPVQEFNETSVTRRNPQTSQALRNYWGYDPVAFFAPKASYSSSGGVGQQKLEFKEMVRAFHNAGIEVILDVAFNHTAEGDELGPIASAAEWLDALYRVDW